MLISTSKKHKQTETTTDLLKRAGYLYQTDTGEYLLIGFSQQIINKITTIIQEELEREGLSQINLNQLQSASLWQQTNRLDIYKDEILKVSDRRGRELILAPTQEEQATYLAKQLIKSYKQLSLGFYQINNKFRDELRQEHGLIRTREFLMMDAYSFHQDQENLNEYYQKVKRAFIRIFDRLDLKYEIKESDNGEIGGNFSEEFVATTSMGDIEIGHIFQLGDKYSRLLDARFQSQSNTLEYFQMGCYGIGITRLFMVIADQFRTGDRLNWSKELKLFDQIIFCDQLTEEILAIIKQYESVLLDDRQLSNSRKRKDLELIGII